VKIKKTINVTTQKVDSTQIKGDGDIHTCVCTH